MNDVNVLEGGWTVDRPAEGEGARANGEAFAAQFAQYLADNPAIAGDGRTLNEIVRAMARNGQLSDGPDQAHALGFFSFLEKLLYYAAEHIDVFTYVEQAKANSHVLRVNPTCACD